MMQAEGTRMTLEDKRELERQIDELKSSIAELMKEPKTEWKNGLFERPHEKDILQKNKELRRLRRMRE